MSASTRIIRAVLLAAAAAALAIAAYQLREKHQEAKLTVQDIHDQLDALDPATWAAVVARLTSDEVKRLPGTRWHPAMCRVRRQTETGQDHLVGALV